MHNQISVDQAIQSSGLRLTRQRQLILQVLTDSQEHLDAEQLHDRLKVQNPRIGLATVYRTLGVLKSLGLVNEQSLGEEHGHFEAASTKPHYHFTCTDCHKVIEFELPALARLAQHALDTLGARVEVIQLSASGKCSACKEKP
jgi:Fe2+ or Zn2+ uptake regulation protein